MATYVDGDFSSPVLISERPTFAEPGKSTHIIWERVYVQTYSLWEPSPVGTVGEDLRHLISEEVIGFIGPLVQFRQNWQSVPGEDPDNPLDETEQPSGTVSYSLSSYTYPGRKIKKTRLVRVQDGTIAGARNPTFQEAIYFFGIAEADISSTWVLEEEYLVTVAQPVTLPIIAKTETTYSGSVPTIESLPPILTCGGTVTQFTGWDYGGDGTIQEVVGTRDGSVGELLDISVNDRGGGVWETRTSTIHVGYSV